jgi:UDP:flavonoid glycosyltransferase YjiC (YdhE family)
MNLDHIVSYGAGIRIPAKQWSAQKIREAVKLITSNVQYKNNTAKLMTKIKEIDGKQECAKMIWEFIAQRI